ncbi:UDP-3-O-(3-hydroxymyristoyl)glucosamine N-acyltransferase [Defluviimonas sp. WL0024]|uniref:UDP-3-O-acylglucosamine N-acyltransferase n=2 Tax=Albidovulum TaxID=205889 RepID=A0ABT3IX47_9RHOB|nr:MULTISPECIES: UDP-3-O-(3-hydroxymyristoyl)glucosamine N-acyltransferase [Defluviimonas]MCU9846421.1 UDP-3-O-(3-hydroxymyristoyl)glucosamine N-acyltransferase [Defluviimonas sp. WL0024]MCW3780000.1 UDP-3-O-(3-hydroxymyristoyl)glucosamine N-acyltransferase [Defluviimonas salinarum]
MPRSFSIAEIAEALGARTEGDVTVRITGAAEPGMAGPEDLALAMDPKYAAGLAGGRARAAMLWEGADRAALGLDAAIFVARPRLAMAGVTRVLDPGPAIAPGIHPTAVVDPTAEIGAGAAVGAFAVIGAGVRIGAGARIADHVTIGPRTAIGADALIHSGVRIGAGVTIGDRFICQPNTVIGADGFSFVTPEKSGVEEIRESLGERAAIRAQRWTRIHSLGGVVIGDDVEFGANVTVDAGTIRPTRVGSGTKIDNLCMVAHNVTIGRDCLFASQTGVAGSTRVGDRVVLGGQCGVSDNIFIGDDVIAGGGTKIYTNAPAGRVLLGAPALKMETHVEAWKNIRRLGRLFAQVAELRDAVTRIGDGAAKGGSDADNRTDD